MQKIPTVYMRDPIDPTRLLPKVTPGCEWVFTDSGVRATRMFDGTCIWFDGTNWWTRREVKPNKNPPPNFVLVQYDSNTLKSVGWEPATQSSFAKYLRKAVGDYPFADPDDLRDIEAGTYELCGPKINGNPEGFDSYTLVRHGTEELKDVPSTFGDLEAWLKTVSIEGVVWYHPDGMLAKLKRRDFH